MVRGQYRWQHRELQWRIISAAKNTTPAIQALPVQGPIHKPVSASANPLKAWALKARQKAGLRRTRAPRLQRLRLSVSVRKGPAGDRGRNRDRRVAERDRVSEASAAARTSTSDFSSAIQQTVQTAYDIARFTAEDPVCPPPDSADIALPGTP